MRLQCVFPLREVSLAVFSLALGPFLVPSFSGCTGSFRKVASAMGT